MHLAIHIFGLFAIMAMVWVFFFAWLFATIFRGVCSGVSRMTGAKKRYQVEVSTVAFGGQIRCRRVRCRAMNPPEANFCRRCGAPLSALTAQRQRCGTNGNGAGSDENWGSRPISL